MGEENPEVVEIPEEKEPVEDEETPEVQETRLLESLTDERLAQLIEELQQIQNERLEQSVDEEENRIDRLQSVASYVDLVLKGAGPSMPPVPTVLESIIETDVENTGCKHTISELVTMQTYTLKVLKDLSTLVTRGM